MPPPEESPTRTLQVALSAMAVVALTVGLVVGGLVLGISKYAGVDEAAEARAKQAPATMSIPPYRKTPPGKGEPRVKTYAPPPTPTLRLPAGGSTSGSAPAGTGITLTVSPQRVAAGQRIDFSGSYGREGASLRIQRQVGSTWTDFPVSTTVSGGTFSTWITTSQTGTAPFRVVDSATGKPSNVVTVTIG
jgi:hypothetical protein